MPALFQNCRLPNGEVVKMYYIGTLANALGRTTSAIRKWEIAGVIPDSCFRDAYGKRLYTMEQIETIVECAEKAKIKQGSSIANTSFSSKCHKALEALKEKYKGGNESEVKG